MRAFLISIIALAVGALSVVAWNRIQRKEAPAVSEPAPDNESDDDLRARLTRLERLADRSFAAAMTRPDVTKAAGGSEADNSETSRKGPAAPEPPRMETPEEAAKEVIGELTQSGPPQGDWSSRVHSTLETWKTKSALGTKVALSDVQCFARGCTFTGTFPDRDAFDRAIEDMQGSEPFERLNAPSFRSSPMETENGQLKAVWVLYSQERS